MKGDVVLLMNRKVRRGEWHSGRITEVPQVKDGLIRVVKVICAHLNVMIEEREMIE